MAVSGTVLRAKAVLLGDAGVGKTSLTSTFHSDTGGFPKAYTMTTGNHCPQFIDWLLIWLICIQILN